MDTRTELKLIHSGVVAMLKTCKSRRRYFEKQGTRALSKSANTTNWLSYAGRMSKELNSIKRDARYVGLIRALVTGKSYTTVEQSCREGNEVDSEILVGYCSEFGICTDIQTAEEWLNA